MIKKSLLNLFALTMMLGLCAPASAAMIKTDIVLLVDESGSMGTTYHSNLANFIGVFANTLASNGIEARFSLIGFGWSGELIRTVSYFTDAAGISTAASTLNNVGSEERAYDAIGFALDELNSFWDDTPLSFAADAVKNFIMFTNEGDNSIEADYAKADSWLNEYEVLFNAVVDGEGTSDFSSLAVNNGGASFDLSQLAIDAQAFMTGLANAKADETIAFCRANPQHSACVNYPGDDVPEPGTIGLMAGAVALLLRRRSKI